jgi:hypothetical protein
MADEATHQILRDPQIARAQTIIPESDLSTSRIVAFGNWLYVLGVIWRTLRGSRLQH